MDQRGQNPIPWGGAAPGSHGLTDLHCSFTAPPQANMSAELELLWPLSGLLLLLLGATAWLCIHCSRPGPGKCHTGRKRWEGRGAGAGVPEAPEVAGPGCDGRVRRKSIRDSLWPLHGPEDSGCKWTLGLLDHGGHSGQEPAVDERREAGPPVASSFSSYPHPTRR